MHWTEHYHNILILICISVFVTEVCVCVGGGGCFGHLGAAEITIDDLSFINAMMKLNGKTMVNVWSRFYILIYLYLKPSLIL